MSPLAVAVVGGSLLLSAPAWWAVGVEGTLSADVAVQRWLLCLLGVWAVLSLATRMSRWALADAKPTLEKVPAEKAPEMGTARRLDDVSSEPED